MNQTDQRQKLYRMLSVNPLVRAVAARALELEAEAAQREYYLGWEWHEVQTQPQKLRVLVEEGIIRVSFKSNKTTTYRLMDPETTRQALEVIAHGEAVPEGEIPPDLFEDIVGYEDVKYWVKKSLAAEQPVHILMVGPPGTAKSMFLEVLGGLPGSQYALGGSSSKAGIADFLLNFRPRVLVLDELDKMSREDFSVLLSLMQSGVVARLKKNMREVEQMTTWVFAGCNRADRLPPELLSRFIQFEFKVYTREEFIKVAEGALTQLGKDPDLARYIALKVSTRTRDVRQAIHVGKLCDSDEEVDRFEVGRTSG
jgi:Holliday junction DNA helicase RuvB